MQYDDKSRKDATQFLGKSRRPLLVSHAKPDGDALGSLLAMRRLLTAQGLQPGVLLFEPLPPRYAFMAPANELAFGDATQAAGLLSASDGVVIVDTCSYNQLDPIAEWLRNSPLPKLVIDHHGTRDPITNNLLVDDSAAATCLIIYELARYVGWTIDPATATSLFVGVSTDTGWFRHSNSDGRTLRCAAELLSIGVRAFELYELLYHQDSVGRVRLLGEALGTLELHANDAIAMMKLSRNAFDQAQALPGDTEDVVNEPLRIASVVVSVLLVEQPDGQIRVNFRSKAPDSSGRRPVVDVAALARRFGGGGHRHAAGARCKERLEVVRIWVLEAVHNALGSPPGGESSTH